ncbi:MAG: hypothetical protein COY74_10220 [Nitrosopumilales archaeon CG_4_10_14_0_8_um_filter_34_8]|nr:MAG: hypothetical protein COY74_10220 [Nitrosopumilales archaeon CG_4_10_14_0_8_um_filter_34_8]
MIQKDVNDMDVKITTFGISLKDCDLDEEKIASKLIESRFEKKYYKVGLMRAYRPDGTEIPNTADISGFSDRYQLLGKSCSVAFLGNEILLHHKFGIFTSEISYDIKDIIGEISSVLGIINDVSTMKFCKFELILLLRGTGSKDPNKVVATWMRKQGHIGSDTELYHGKMEYENTINPRCTEKQVMAKSGEYAINLRFQSDDLAAICNDLEQSEKIGHDIILEIEK